VTDAPVWWCPALGTVLANEEVQEGVSEVGGHPVVRKPMRQWMLRITAYAERLLQDLDTIEWSDSLKKCSATGLAGAKVRKWIFKSPVRPKKSVCSPRAPTHCPARLTLVLAPEHKLVESDYSRVLARRSSSSMDSERACDKGWPDYGDRRHCHNSRSLRRRSGSTHQLKIIPEVVALIPGDMARRHRVIPVSATPTNVTIALADRPILPRSTRLPFLSKRI